jgi:hypothetical protein
VKLPIEEHSKSSIVGSFEVPDEHRRPQTKHPNSLKNAPSDYAGQFVLPPKEVVERPPRSLLVPEEKEMAWEPFVSYFLLSFCRRILSNDAFADNERKPAVWIEWQSRCHPSRDAEIPAGAPDYAVQTVKTTGGYILT